MINEHQTNDAPQDVPLWKVVRAVIILPLTVTVVIPVGLLLFMRWGIGLRVASNTVLIALGAIFLISGLSMLIGTIRLFATIGKGTLAPWDQTKRLVIAGPYRFVRNPMITSVIAILLGEALILGSLALGIWAFAFATINVFYIPLHEEPITRRAFGESWDEYKANVPRWLPRLTPWRPAGSAETGSSDTDSEGSDSDAD